jgi:putative addiction module component (TIGR02574 family)
MPQTLEDVLRDAMTLLPEERLQLAQDLFASTMTTEERDIEEAWIAEAERRYADWKAGRTTTIPGEQVFRELREKYAGRNVRARR